MLYKCRTVSFKRRRSIIASMFKPFKAYLFLLFFVSLGALPVALSAEVIETVQSIQTRLNHSLGDFERLNEALDSMKSELFALNPLEFKANLEPQKVSQALSQLFEIKKSLQYSLEGVPANYPNKASIVSSVKVMISGVRYVEDYLFEYLNSNFPAKKGGKKLLAFNGDNRFIQKIESFRPDLASLRTGDVILMRAVVFASSLIARISDAPQTYSHMALVWVDPATNKPYLIEGTLNNGFTKTELTVDKFHGQARVSVYRAKDENISKQAGDFGNDQYESGIRLGQPLKYDLELGLEENCKYYCSKFVSWSYNSVLKKKLLPEHPSRLRFNNPHYVSSLGLPESSFMTYAPSDIDLDSTFDLVYEFRNPDLTSSARLDDLITDKLLYWQRKEHLDVVPGSFYDNTAQIITDLVEKPWVRRWLHRLNIHISPELKAKNLSVLGASTIMVMRLKLAILPEYKAYLEKHGVSMPPKEIYALIDRKRKESPSITKQLVPRMRTKLQCLKFYSASGI